MELTAYNNLIRATMEFDYDNPLLPSEEQVQRFREDLNATYEQGRKEFTKEESDAVELDRR